MKKIKLLLKMKFLYSIFFGIFIIILINSCSRCSDCDFSESQEFDCLLVNKSKYSLRFYQYFPAINENGRLIKILNFNDSTIIRIKKDLVSYECDSLFQYSLKVFFDNAKFTIIPHPICENFLPDSSNTYHNYHGFQNLKNYVNNTNFGKTKNIPTYYFTEKDYLMADSITN